MPARFTLDSNVLIYAADGSEAARHECALEIISRAALHDCILRPQALAELFDDVSRKGIMPRSEAAEQVCDWITMFTVVAGASAAAVVTAAEAATAGR